LEWAGEHVDRGQAPIVAVPPGPTLGSARETVRRLSVSLSPSSASVTPGERTSLLVTVSNLGTTVEGADLNLAGLPKDWWSFDPARVSLLPSSETKATLSVHPPRATSSKAGEYPIDVDVATQLDRKASVEATVTIRPFVQLSAELTPENSTGYSRATHEVRIANASNVRVIARVEALDRDQVLQFAPQTSEVALEAGASTTAGVKVRGRRLRWRGRKPAHRFSVRVSAPGAGPTERPASFTQVPLLPKWVPMAATITALALIGGILFLGHASGHAVNLPIQHAGASPTVTEGSVPSHSITTSPTTVAPVTPPPAVTTPLPPAQAAPVPVATAPGTTVPPTTTSTTSATSTAAQLHGIVQWPDKSPAAAVNVVIYPRGFGSLDPAHVPQAMVGTTKGGTYASSICGKDSCANVQAFLELPVSSVFPDGCVLPLLTSTGSATGFPTSGGRVDWTVSDGTCAADPSGRPIDDPNLPAYTTEYVEQRINTLGAASAGTSPTTIGGTPATVLQS
jgi:hypothetical protein